MSSALEAYGLSLNEERHLTSSQAVDCQSKSLTTPPRRRPFEDPADDRRSVAVRIRRKLLAS